MEAYSNCRQFNCIPPIVEQAEYHMFCREKCELYLPEMYNKIGVGLMAWGPLSMALSDAQNGDRLLFSKASFKTKSQSYSWTEDEINKNVSDSCLLYRKKKFSQKPFISYAYIHIFNRTSIGRKRRLTKASVKVIASGIWVPLPRNWAAVHRSYQLPGRWSTSPFNVYCSEPPLLNNSTKVFKHFR